MSETMTLKLPYFPYTSHNLVTNDNIMILSIWIVCFSSSDSQHQPHHYREKNNNINKKVVDCKWAKVQNNSLITIWFRFCSIFLCLLVRLCWLIKMNTSSSSSILGDQQTKANASNIIVNLMNKNIIKIHWSICKLQNLMKNNSIISYEQQYIRHT